MTTEPLNTNPTPAPPARSGLRKPFLFRSCRRRTRWILRVIVVMVLGALVGIWALTQSPLTSHLVLGRLRGAFKIDLRAGDVSIAPDGMVVIERGELILPGLASRPASLLTFERARARVDWAAAVGGEPIVHELIVEQPRLRVSMARDGSLNLDALKLPARPGTFDRLPSVRVIDGVVELGEHDGDDYALLKQLTVQGALAPASDGTPRLFDVHLQQTGAPSDAVGPPAPPLRLDGTVSLDGDIELRLSSIGLEQWLPAAVPSTQRDIIADLGLSGDIAVADFKYSKAAGPVARVVLRGVGMNLPVRAHDTGARARLSEVDGTLDITDRGIEAHGSGRIKDLAYTFDLVFDGFATSAPFTLTLRSDNFPVEANPALVEYAPPLVRARLQNFARAGDLSPTAILSTVVNLRRGAPTPDGAPGPIEFDGELWIRDGHASFQGFPYAFGDIEAHFTFSDHRVDIAMFRGVAPNGATIAASGSIVPPTDDCQLDLDVAVRNVPIDSLLEEGLGPRRRSIVDALFSTDRYRALLDAGLVRAPDSPSAPGAPPAFALGGRIDVDIHVHRPPGDDVLWDTNVTVRGQRIGILAEKFPVPVVGEGVRLRVDRLQGHESGRVEAGVFRGLTGGVVDLTAEFVIPSERDSPLPIIPVVNILARRVPLDELIIQALPGEEAGEPVRRVLRDLNITTLGTADVDILARSPDRLGFDATITFDGGRALPRGDDPAEALEFTSIAGKLVASELHIDLDLTGQVSPPSTPGAPRFAPSHVAIQLAADVAENGPQERGFGALVSTAGTDAATPIERIVALFSAPAADKLRALRRDHFPRGSADTATVVQYRSGELRQLATRLRNIQDLALEAGGRDFNAAHCDGTVVVQTVPTPRLLFEDFAASLEFEGAPAGRLAIRGETPVREWGTATNAPRELLVTIGEGSFASPLFAHAVRQVGGEALERRLAAIQPTGTFDAMLLVRDLSLDPAEPVNLSGRLAPRSIAFTPDDVRVAFDRVSGYIDIGPRLLRLVDLRCVAPDWTLSASGTIEPAGSGGATIDLDLDAEGRQLTPDARAMLPPPVADVLDRAALDVLGPFHIARGRLKLVALPGVGVDAFSFTGDAEFDGLTADVGVLLAAARGTASIETRRDAAHRPTSFRVRALADHLLAAGIRLTDATATIAADDTAARVSVTDVAARCHGGRIVAAIDLDPASPGDTRSPRHFVTDLRFSGVAFGSLVDNMRDARLVGPPAPGHDPLDLLLNPPPINAARGYLDGQMTLGGEVGDPLSRRGRGHIVVADGRIVHSPNLVRLLRVSNLQPPIDERIDFAQAQFFISGDVIAFENVSINTRSIEVYGVGTMSWPDTELDMRFNSRSSRPIFFISRLSEAIRDGLVTASVRGTLDDPDISLLEFPDARDMLREVTGNGHDRARDYIELRDRSPPIRDRIRRSGPGVAPTRRTGHNSQDHEWQLPSTTASSSTRPTRRSPRAPRQSPSARSSDAPTRPKSPPTSIASSSSSEERPDPSTRASSATSSSPASS